MNEFYFSKISPIGEFVSHVWAGKLCFQAPSYLTPPEQVVWLTHGKCVCTAKILSTRFAKMTIHLFSKKVQSYKLTHQIPKMS